jgi:hypothetical protein
MRPARPLAEPRGCVLRPASCGAMSEFPAAASPRTNRTCPAPSVSEQDAAPARPPTCSRRADGLAANALLRAERRRSNFLVLPGSTEVDIGASILDRLTQVVQKRPRFKPWRNGMDITRRSADKWIVDFGAI